MTPAELRALLSKATPGPWCCADCNGHLECREIGYIGHLELHAPSSPFQRAESEHDARLITAAVNALPALLALWEAAERRGRHDTNCRMFDGPVACDCGYEHIEKALNNLKDIK